MSAMNRVGYGHVSVSDRNTNSFRSCLQEICCVLFFCFLSSGFIAVPIEVCFKVGHMKLQV